MAARVVYLARAHGGGAARFGGLRALLFGRQLKLGRGLRGGLKSAMMRRSDASSYVHKARHEASINGAQHHRLASLKPASRKPTPPPLPSVPFPAHVRVT